MSDPSPNTNVNLSGSGSIAHVQRPDGEFVPQQGTDAGEAKVSIANLPADPPTEAKQTEILTAIGQTNTKLDTANTKLEAANTKADGTNSRLDDVKTGLTTLGEKIDATNTRLDDTNQKLDDVISDLDELVLANDELGAWTDHDSIAVPVEPSAAQQLGNHPCSEIQIVADAANTHPIYVSGAGVSSTKTPGLNAEDVETIKRVSNTNEFYVVAAAGHTGQVLRYRSR